MAKFDNLKFKPDCRACPDRKSCIRHQTSCNKPGPSLCKYIHVHVSILRFTMVGKIIRVLEKNAWTCLTQYHKSSDKYHFIYLSVSFAELSFYLVFSIYLIGMCYLITWYLDHVIIPKLSNSSRIYFFDILVLVICTSSLSPFLTWYSFSLAILLLFSTALSGFFSVVNAHTESLFSESLMLWELDRKLNPLYWMACNQCLWQITPNSPFQPNDPIYNLATT